MRASLALLFAGAVLLVQQTALAATPGWSVTLPDAADGASYGDVDGDGQFEIGLILRGDPGQVVLMSHAGEVLWTHTASTGLFGYATFGDYDGNGTEELAYCEADEDSPCRVLNADGSVRYTFGSYYYPGMTGSGPTVADVTGDGADDLVILSWGGTVVLVDGRTGAELWTYDAWESRGELLFGPSTIADLDGDGSLEVVFGGWQEGTLFVLDAETGTEVWEPLGLGALWGSSFYGNGALVEDLDADGTGEIIVALNGDVPSVAAFSASGETLWRTLLPTSAWFSWLTPVATDLDGDGLPEILAQSVDGELYVFGGDGALIASPSLGADAWIAPAFIDLDFDLRPEIIAGTVEGIVVLDGLTFAERERLDDVDGGGTYPQILVGDLSGDGQVDVVTGSWGASRINQYIFSAADVTTWSALGGGPDHQGSVALACFSVCASSEAIVDESANLGDGVLVGADATIGENTNIGDDSIIGAGASIEQRATIRPGTSIGADSTIEERTFVGRDTTVGESTTVGERSFVGQNVTIGADVVVDERALIWSGASVGEGTVVGARSRIGGGVSVGEDVQLGERVLLRTNVSVGAGTVIGQRTSVGSNTVIGENVSIGESCRIGRNVVIGDGVTIPDGTVVPNGSVLP